MPVPTYDHFIEPLLRYLATRPEGVSAADAHEAVATRLGLSPDERAERLPSGVQHVYKNRNGWAQDRLKRAGFSISPRYGFWQLTPEGVAYEARHKTITVHELEQLSSAFRISRLKPKRMASSTRRAPLRPSPLLLKNPAPKSASK